MPVSSENSIAGPYSPNGETTSFAFEFKAASAGEVVAVDGDGNLISTALYSVTLDDDEGGTLTFGTAPEASDYPVIYVASEPQLTQPSDFDNTGPSFNPAALTRALDRSAIRDLKLKRDIDRSLKLPFGEESVIFPGAADRANKFVSFLPDGTLVMSSGTGADAGLRPDLAAPTGGEMVGLTDDQNVRGRLVETKSVGDDGAAPAAADNGPTIATVFDEQKQSTSISYNPTIIPMDPRKSIQIAGQYVIKNLVNLWAKTSAVAMNWLNSGLTLAADATDDTIFQFGGSTGLPAWGNQNNIIGGAYNILKADGALVRKNPDFPRYFNDPGGSFMTNWSLTDVSFAGPYGVMLGDVYSQQALIQNFHCVGTVEQILSVQGHFITIENLDKTGFTGSTTEPLMVLGDPDNINPTTNITCNRVILDLNGNVNKDSVHVINAKNTLFDEYYNELTAFKTMLKIEDSYGTRSVRSMFVTALTSGVIELDNSDFHMDAFEPTTSTGKWWDFFTRTNKSPLRIDRLRQFYSAGLPLDEDITVKEIQNVGGSEPMIDVPFMNPVGNCCGNPGFVDGLTGWSVDGSLTATLVAGNKFVPGGKILRLTVASDTGGVKYITQSLAGMAGAEFDGRPMTMIMIGEVTGTAGDSFMGPAETSLGVNQGRVYGGQGLVEVGAVIVGSDGVAYFHVTNPKAGAQYDIHYLSAQFGRQMTPVLPIPMQPLVADPTGGATVDAESRTAIASIINSLQAAGIMRTTT